MSMPIIIIGSGLAGYNLARELRKLDKISPLMIITADDGAFYSKPMLSAALSKQKQPAELIMSDAAKMASELNAEIHTQQRVTALDAARHQVTLSNGSVVEYKQCVLAVGANPVRIPIAGSASEQIYQVNHLQDYSRFRQAIAGKKRIAVIGPGLIGCEFANDLISGGYDVHVIGPDEYPLSQLVPPAVGVYLQQKLQSAGVHWHLQTTVKTANKIAEQIQLTFSNGDSLNVDTCLLAVGLRPNTELAAQSGLTVKRGFVVDRYLQTSATDVFAVGDCAEVAGRVMPYVLPLMQGVRALAMTLKGTPTVVEYPPMPVVVKTTLCPLVVSPALDDQGEWSIEMLPDGVRALFKTGEQLTGFALCGSAVNDKLALTKQLPNIL